MKDLFIPYELAVIAKEKGFNQLCFALVTEKNAIHFLDASDKEELRFDNQVEEYNSVPCVPAPLYQQIVDWLREEKQIQIELTCWYGTAYWKFEIFKVGNNNRENLFPVNWSADNDYHQEKGTSSIFKYYEALNKAIEEAFKLI